MKYLPKCQSDPLDEWSRAPPHAPREEVAVEEVRVRISAEYIRFFDHFWRCVNASKSTEEKNFSGSIILSS